MATPKTPVSILQETLVKKGTLPIFECKEKTGSQHMPMFKFSASALNVSVEAEASTKREAKQAAAKLLLQRLVEMNLYDENEPLKKVTNHQSVSTSLSEIKHEISVPMKTSQPSSSVEGQYSSFETQEIPQHKKEDGLINGVVFLEYLCQKHGLPCFPQYTPIGESGPPHAKAFTVQVVLGIHKVIATSTTKKQARQMAASQLYFYLNENLHGIEYLRQKANEELGKEERETKEKSAVASQLYLDSRNGPSISSHVSSVKWEYKLAFKNSIDIKKRDAALAILNKHVHIRNPENAVEEALNALGLEFEWQAIPRVDNRETHVLQIKSVQFPASIVPLNPLITPNYLRGATAMEAVAYLKDMLA